MCFLVHLTAHFCAFGKVAARKKKRSGAPIQRRRIRSCACFVRPSCSSVFRSVLLLLNCAVKSSYPPSAPLVYIVFRHTHHRRNYETALETAFPPPRAFVDIRGRGGDNSGLWGAPRRFWASSRTLSNNFFPWTSDTDATISLIASEAMCGGGSQP